MNLKNCIVFGVLSFLLLCIGCATNSFQPGSERCIQNCDVPSWVNSPKSKDTKAFKAFVGESFKHSTSKLAKQYAEQGAREKVIENLWGTYGKRKVDDVLANTGYSSADIIDDASIRTVETKWESRGVVRGDIDEYYVQTWEKKNRDGSVTIFYRVFVLYMVDRSIVKEYLKDVMQYEAQQTKDEKKNRNINRALELMNKLQREDFQDW